MRFFKHVLSPTYKANAFKIELEQQMNVNITIKLIVRMFIKTSITFIAPEIQTYSVVFVCLLV